MDKEINIAISTTHDARGVEEAEKSLKEIKEAGKDSTPEPPREAQEAYERLTRAMRELAEAIKAQTERQKEHMAVSQKLAEQEKKRAEGAEKLAEAERELAETAAEQIEQAEESAEATKEVAEAREEMSGAAEEAADAEEALSLYMELENKTIKELQAEVKRLTAERRKAAAAGDSQAYKNLSNQCRTTKKALAEMTAQQHMAKTATMSQVQAGMQFAAGLQSLGSQLKSGSVDIAGMASQVMALGAALKAGMGPIGWVTLAIEGLIAIIDLCSDKSEELGNKQAETARKMSEAAAAMQAAGKALADAMLEPLEREAQEKERLRENEQRREQNALKAQQDQAAQARAQEINKIKKNYEAQQALLDEAIARQREADEERYGAGAPKTEELKKLEDEKYKLHQETTEKIRKLETEANVAAADAQKEAVEQKSRQIAADIASTQEQIENLKAEADPDELQALENPELQKILDSITDYKAELQSAEARLQEAKQVREEKGITWGDRAEAALESAGALLAAGLEAITGDFAAAGEAWEDCKKKAGEVVESNEELDDEVKNALRLVQEGNQKIASSNKELAKLLNCNEDEVQERLGVLLRVRESKKQLDEKLATQKIEQEAIKSEVEAANKSTEAAHENATQEDRIGQAQKARDDAERSRAKAAEEAAEEQKKRDKEWAKTQSKSLDEQAEWLRRTLGSLQRGSTEYEKWEAEARKVANKKVSDTLGKLDKIYKRSTSYAEEDNRTESEKLKADGLALERKRAHLRQLLATDGLDAETQEKINDELVEVEKEMKGYRQAVRRLEQAALQSLQNYRAPEMKGKDKGNQKQLDRLRKAYERLVAQAERAARNGNDNQLAAIRKQMSRYVVQMERCGATAGQANTMHREVVNKLQLARGHAEKLGVSMSAQEEQQLRAMITARRNAGDAITMTQKVRAVMRLMDQEAAERRRQVTELKQQTAAQQQQGAQNTSAAKLEAEVGQMKASIEQSTAQVNAAAEGLSAANAAEAAQQEALSRLATVAQSRTEQSTQILALINQLIAREQADIAKVQKQIASINEAIKKMQKL